MKANYDRYCFNKYDNTHLFNTALVMYYLRDLVQIGRQPENLVGGNLAATGSKIEILSMLYYNGYITIKEIGVRLKLCIPNYVTEVLYASYFLKLTEILDTML